MTIINLFENKRRTVIDVLTILFGISSWIGINSIFNETPLLLKQPNAIPEGIKIMSYISIIVQIANLGPIIYTFLKKRTRITEEFCIYSLILFIIIVNFLLCFYYDVTMEIFNQKRSVVFLACVFLLSIHACTSSVLYIPYMRHFSQVYMGTFMFGEGLSGLLPSVIALLQGIGDKNNLEQVHFSTFVYFLIENVLLVITLIAFYLLNNLNVCKKDREHILNNSKRTKEKKIIDDENYDETFDASRIALNKNDSNKKLQRICLLLFLFIINMFQNGFMPTIQANSAKVYEENVFYYVVTLGSLLSTVGVFLAIFFAKNKNFKVIIAMFLILITMIIFVIVQAILSTVIIGGSNGAIIFVILWLLLTSLLSFLKSNVLCVLRSLGGNSLYWAGTITQMGSLSGAVIIFVLDNIFSIFSKK